MYDAAITCLPLLNYVVNSTNRHIGVAVSVTCPDMETWSDGLPDLE